MKRIYKVRSERGNGLDHWEYQVIAANGQEAAKKGIKQARRDSGVQTGWRVTNVAEQEGSVIV